MALSRSSGAMLAKIAASNGISGLSLGNPKKKYDDEMPAEDMPEDKPDDMQACLSDLSDAIISGDKDAIMSGLQELIDRIGAKDEEQDQQSIEV